MSQARLQKIFHESLPVELLAKEPALDASRTLLFVNRLISCLKSGHYSQKMVALPFVMVLDPVKQGAGLDYLDENNITNLLTQWKWNDGNILIIDYDGKQILDPSYENIVIDGEDIASALSRDRHVILFYIKQLAVRVYVNGYCVKSTENIHSMKRIGEVRPTDLPPSEYRFLISKHFSEKLLKGKKIGYWHNKSERILKQKPEDYFRDELLEYLKENLTPEGIAEKEVPNASTNDAIDIRIMDTTNGIEFTIIEIKWMGTALSIKKDKTIGTTTYSDESPNGGIHQLGIYLTDEPLAKRGCLVTYDARLDAEKNEIVWTTSESSWHKNIDKPPMRLYIKSESASQEGKKIAKQSKKK